MLYYPYWKDVIRGKLYLHKPKRSMNSLFFNQPIHVPSFRSHRPIHKLTLQGRGEFCVWDIKQQRVNETGASAQHSAFCTSSSLKSCFWYPWPTASPALTACSVIPLLVRQKEEDAWVVLAKEVWSRPVTGVLSRCRIHESMIEGDTRHQPLSFIYVNICTYVNTAVTFPYCFLVRHMLNLNNSEISTF